MPRLTKPQDFVDRVSLSAALLQSFKDPLKYQSIRKGVGAIRGTEKGLRSLSFTLSADDSFFQAVFWWTSRLGMALISPGTQSAIKTSEPFRGPSGVGGIVIARPSAVHGGGHFEVAASAEAASAEAARAPRRRFEDRPLSDKRDGHISAHASSTQGTLTIDLAKRRDQGLEDTGTWHVLIFTGMTAGDAVNKWLERRSPRPDSSHRSPITSSNLPLSGPLDTKPVFAAWAYDLVVASSIRLNVERTPTPAIGQGLTLSVLPSVGATAKIKSASRPKMAFGNWFAKESPRVTTLASSNRTNMEDVRKEFRAVGKLGPPTEELPISTNVSSDGQTQFRIAAKEIVRPGSYNISVRAEMTASDGTVVERERSVQINVPLKPTLALVDIRPFLVAGKMRYRVRMSIQDDGGNIMIPDLEAHKVKLVLQGLKILEEPRLTRDGAIESIVVVKEGATSGPRFSLALGGRRLVQDYELPPIDRMVPLRDRVAALDPLERERIRLQPGEHHEIGAPEGAAKIHVYARNSPFAPHYLVEVIHGQSHESARAATVVGIARGSATIDLGRHTPHEHDVVRITALGGESPRFDEDAVLARSARRVSSTLRELLARNHQPLEIRGVSFLF